jgi:hypothetical protein
VAPSRIAYARLTFRSLTPGSSLPGEKLIVTHLLKGSSSFLEPEVS